MSSAQQAQKVSVSASPMVEPCLVVKPGQVVEPGRGLELCALFEDFRIALESGQVVDSRPSSLV